MKRDPYAAPPAPATIAAKQAGLRYVHDKQPGIARQLRGKHFRYRDADGQIVTDTDTLARIKALVIPPAWTEVWICKHPLGHLQVTGRDARGRKQYRYHARWRTHRDDAKYGRMLDFGKALPAIRQTAEQALRKPGLPREKVLATIVLLLEATLMRIGNEEYARENKSFGLTTLRDRHVRLDGSKVQFRFRGKSGVHHAVEVHDRRLANIIGRIRDLPGQELFQYEDDDGNPHAIDSADVNDYLQTISGADYTAKDFRTWAGTVLAAAALQEYDKFDSEAQAKKNIVQAIASVAKKLGNTPTICRKCYIHPVIIESYLGGTILSPPVEAAVLTLLQQRLE
ncbi:DNA topoisomerase IB [Duganella sp. FT135W]|uniref:DNA topoisomerase n=1 Tax=Duganella flavida TaxID=2692175 RepID=A0A6L8K4Y3_9BURK|nr:DNA topoisomerase IB [Duganella flavida]MYM22539.1 DNA topoisomerase IB [Duganella flavida]